MPSGNLAVAAAFFTALGAAVEREKKNSLEKVGQVVEDAAKNAMGNPGNDYGWPPLQDETIARKANGNTPLVETGELQQSVQHKVVDDTVYVGSDNPKAIWHELGTATVPARSFLAASMLHSEEDIKKLIGEDYKTALTGRNIP